MSILTEIKRRKIFQVIAVYAVVAWLVVQVITSIEGPLNLPEWTDTLVIVLLGLGFPVLLVVSWAFNVTPDGLVRDDGAGEPAKGPGRTIEFVLLGVGALAISWLLYRTEFSDAPQTEPQVAEATASDVLPNSIAVLPFANLSPDPDNAFFAAGIHDTILNELAKISDMHVISRTAMMRYADGVTSIPQVAEELRVGTVMEGSVQYAGGRVLVTAQLIDPATNAHLWSENYDREFADIFAIQADIATQIALAMKTQLTADERVSLSDRITNSPEAYALYLHAMELMDWDFSPDDSNPEIHSLLDEAIGLDPSFARAYATKANIYAFNRLEQTLAVEFANKALAIDPSIGIAYSALATTHNRGMREGIAREMFEAALRLSPNDIDILDDYARFLSSLDKEYALEITNRALELDPGRQRLLRNILTANSDWDAALANLRLEIASEPDRYGFRIAAAGLEHRLGNTEGAIREARIATGLRQIEALEPGGLALSVRSYGRLGLADEARELYEVLLERERQQPGYLDNPAYWAIACIGVGDFECVLEYLEVLAEHKENGFRSIWSRELALNRDDVPELEQPEFVELRKQLGYEVPGL